jgi:4-carboxymuconolactone decarboxylase
MSDSERRKRGEEMFDQVYGGTVPLPSPEQRDEFLQVMLDQLFAETWSRGTLSVRDRRLMLLGVIAAQGEAELFGLQTRAALRRGELDAQQIQDLLIMLTQYVGYPRASKLRPAVRAAIEDLGR